MSNYMYDIGLYFIIQ